MARKPALRWAPIAAAPQCHARVCPCP
jgi:hypothetical protein